MVVKSKMIELLNYQFDRYGEKEDHTMIFSPLDSDIQESEVTMFRNGEQGHKNSEINDVFLCDCCILSIGFIFITLNFNKMSQNSHFLQFIARPGTHAYEYGKSFELVKVGT